MKTGDNLQSETKKKSVSKFNKKHIMKLTSNESFKNLHFTFLGYSKYSK